jgi:ATP-dependent Clp protease ATP-binding subunit ClpA
MRSEHIKFFDLLGPHSRLTIRMLVPNKYKKLDTYTFACICYKQLLLMKVVSDNMKECASRISESVIKTLNKDDTDLLDFENVELDDDMESLIDNYNYFSSKYSDKLSSEIVTTYVSYLLITQKSFSSYKFFKECLYQKGYDSVISELQSALNGITGIDIPDELNKYGKFLTNGLTLCSYPCFGRDAEIKNCVNSLCRMTKSNIILVGNPGVGKTSVVHGVCNYLQSEKCPKSLRSCIVYELNYSKLVGGTMYRGDLEARLDKIIEILSDNKNIIVFIDEIQTLFHKSTNEQDSSVIQNILKPFLSDKSRVIGCTTQSEYKIIESDSAFERRFTKIVIDEMLPEYTVETLIDAKTSFEKYYNIVISDDLCKYVVETCNIYYKNRYFPDKAFDILDKACVLCTNECANELSIENIDNSVYSTCGINPKSRNLSDLYKIENELKNHIIGQNHAVESICKSLKKYYLGVNDKTKPIGSYLFVGSTGVGKTELCKQLSKLCFTDESFIRFDMSEFMESHSISKLIGSPPGYIGYSSGGALTEKVKHLPFSIILFDEIEKAHQDVMNILLQIMDDGRLSDSFGNTVNFCNCLIILTSNIGCKDMFEKNCIGFSQTAKSISNVKSSVNDYFSPEFRNRLTDIVVFNTLSKDSFESIFTIKLNEFVDRYSGAGISVKFTDLASNELRSRCYSEKDGVRYISKIISDTIEMLILDSVESGNTNITIDYNKKFLEVKHEKLRERETC